MSVPPVFLVLAVAWPVAVAVSAAIHLAWRHARALVEQHASAHYVGPPSIVAAGPRWWRVWMWLSAPIPALVLALTMDEGGIELSWWLLGGDWRLDPSRRALLGFTALLWSLAGIYAWGYLAGQVRLAREGDPRAERRLQGMALLWPLTLAGNLLLIVAEDIASFYTGFALMTFAAYGLVVHEGSREAQRGGRAYLIMAVLGEGMILAGLLWAAGSVGTLSLGGLREGVAASSQATAMATLLWLGFGVKAGVVGLHVWLPLAHPVAPTPASAVLSGAMIKAGLLGWWHTLPLGIVALPELGALALAAGLIAAFGAALYGVTQRHPKAVLAYSSVSQMGMMTALVGVGLMTPTLWPALAPALVLFAVHHGLNKGALFLGVGITEHPPRLPAWLLWSLLALPALSLSGALASGLPTKWAFKSGLYDAGWGGVVSLLSWAAVGTTLLMARALWCQAHAWREARHEDGPPATTSMTLSWGLCVLLAATGPWWLALPVATTGAVSVGDMPPLAELPGLVWPALLGGSIAVLSVVAGNLDPRWRERFSGVERLPPGDLWCLYERLVRWLGHAGRSIIIGLVSRREAMQRNASVFGKRLTAGLDAAQGIETRLRRWAIPLMGICALLLVVLLRAV